jgi:pyruvate carboxylase
VTDLLFVYGTLMKGHRDDWQQRVGARLVGRGRITGKLYRLGKFPGAVTSAGNGSHIQGEVYHLSDASRALRILDEYEEFEPNSPKGSLFIRKRMSVEMEDGSSAEAWVYVYNRSVKKANLIRSGNFNKKVSVRR